MNLLQLHWAFLQGTPGKRETIKAARAEEKNAKAIELIAWCDEHFT